MDKTSALLKSQEVFGVRDVPWPWIEVFEIFGMFEVPISNMAPVQRWKEASSTSET